MVSETQELTGHTNQVGQERQVNPLMATVVISTWRIWGVIRLERRYHKGTVRMQGFVFGGLSREGEKYLNWGYK